jgi:hypothetical protein
MSHGFAIYDTAGVLSLSQDDLAIQFIDLFSVSPLTTGSRTYTNLGFSNVVAVATPDEPTVSNAASVISANFITVTTVVSGGTVTVSWAPKYQLGSVYDVNIYVFGY